MADEHVDPSANTEAFQAFVRRTDAEPNANNKGRTLAIVGGVVVVVVLVALLIIATMK
jgi:hypothetical protein